MHTLITLTAPALALPQANHRIPINHSHTSSSSTFQIHRALVPEAGAVRAELYKLNIMTKGGFFKAHKDTPRGDAATCFGTLVVVLPVPFTGGKYFRVEHSISHLAAITCMFCDSSRCTWTACVPQYACTRGLFPCSNNVSCGYDILRRLLFAQPPTGAAWLLHSANFDCAV